MATDCFWEILREHGKTAHKERVAKTPERIAFAEKMLDQHGIVYEVKNTEIGHIHAYRKRDGKLFQFWCGNGNFLVEIYRRKLEICKDEKDGLKALASIVGIDIQADNCEESRKRLMAQYLEAFPNANEVCILLAAGILQNNIICGDGLKIIKRWEPKDGN